LHQQTQRFAEAPERNRLYGNAAYCNGYLYAQPSSMVLKQYQFQNGLLNPTLVAQSSTASGVRGGNITWFGQMEIRTG
jgi:hypothetical protein